MGSIITIHNATVSDIEEVDEVIRHGTECSTVKPPDIIMAKKFLSDRIVSEESTILLAKKTISVWDSSTLPLFLISECISSVSFERLICRPNS